MLLEIPEDLQVTGVPHINFPPLGTKRCSSGLKALMFFLKQLICNSLGIPRESRESSLRKEMPSAVLITLLQRLHETLVLIHSHSRYQERQLLPLKTLRHQWIIKEHCKHLCARSAT